VSVPVVKPKFLSGANQSLEPGFIHSKEAPLAAGLNAKNGTN